jgi:hypothetical protein
MTTQPRTSYKNILGKRLGLGAYNELLTNSTGTYKQLTSKAVSATITISAEGATQADQRDITITLLDGNGNALDYAEEFTIENYAASTMLDWSTGGSTGLAQGASGKLLALVAKKVFKGITTTSGVITLTYVDTGTVASYLGITLPNGVRIAGGLMTNA